MIPIHSHILFYKAKQSKKKGARKPQMQEAQLGTSGTGLQS